MVGMMDDKENTYTEKVALIQAIQMLGFDPMSMGPKWYLLWPRQEIRRGWCKDPPWYFSGLRRAPLWTHSRPEKYQSWLPP